jgi:hypothetical protein
MSIVAVTLVPILERAILSRPSILKTIALTILPRRKGAAIVAALTLGLVRRSVAERLWSVRRGARLRLKAWLRLRLLLVGVLPLRGRGETIGQRVKVAVIVHPLIILSSRPLLTALRQGLRGLRSGDQSEIMFCVLQIILGSDRISACVSISRELEVFLRDVMRIAPYFDVWPIRFIGSRQRIRASPIVRWPAAHPFVLTWSHFDFPISIRLAQAFPIVSGRGFLEFDASGDGPRLRVTRMS